MLTDEMIEKNKQDFLNILTDALERRPGAKIDELISKLSNSDFFIAPASTKYHASYKGGLVDHCLNVYYNMMSIAKNKHLLAIYADVPEVDEDDHETGKMTKLLVEGCIDPDSIAIIALLHDFSKMNYYKIDYRNKKVYCESGSKSDNGGRFDWVTVSGYSTIPPEERFLYGSHEETAEFMIRQFVPLTYEESTAVLHHHFALSFDSIKDVGVVGNIYERYPLAVLLHCADVISAYLDERIGD